MEFCMSVDFTRTSDGGGNDFKVLLTDASTLKTKIFLNENHLLLKWALYLPTSKRIFNIKIRQYWLCLNITALTLTHSVETFRTLMLDLQTKKKQNSRIFVCFPYLLFIFSSLGYKIETILNLCSKHCVKKRE